MQSSDQSLARRRLIKKSTGMIVIILMLAGFLMTLPAASVNAISESAPPLDCLSCHPKTLKYHDKLGSGNKACWACHDSTDMKMLRLADETSLPLSDSTQLCAQCHQKRYDAWKEGTHGIPGTVATVRCAACHNQHQPQIALSGITKPHPAPTPPPPLPPLKTWAIFGFLLLLLSTVTLVAVGSRKGEGA